MLDRRDVRALYPCLSPVQARQLAVLGQVYPWWALYPAPGFPYIHLYCAVYLLSTPQVQVKGQTLGRLADEIDGFLDYARTMGWQNAVREWTA